MVTENVSKNVWDLKGRTTTDEDGIHFNDLGFQGGRGGAHVFQLRRDVSDMNAQFQARLALLQTDLQRSEEVIQGMNAQVLLLTEQLALSKQQNAKTMKTTKDFSTIQLRKYEPTTQPSTYIVPKRVRSTKIDRLTTSIPFSILSVLFGVSLAAAISLAAPSLALWTGMTPFLLTLVRGLFITVASTTIISFMLELVHTQKIAR